MNHLPQDTDNTENPSQTGKRPWTTPTVNELSVKETAAGGTNTTEGAATRNMTS